MFQIELLVVDLEAEGAHDGLELELAEIDGAKLVGVKRLSACSKTKRAEQGALTISFKAR